MNTDPETHAAYPFVMWWGPCTETLEASPQQAEGVEGVLNDESGIGTRLSATCRKCELIGEESCVGQNLITALECSEYDPCVESVAAVLALDLSDSAVLRKAMLDYPAVLRINPIFGSVEVVGCSGRPVKSLAAAQTGHAAPDTLSGMVSIALVTGWTISLTGFSLASR
jgi:membrane-associated protease RseP (regulator of RpoE activity)